MAEKITHGMSNTRLYGIYRTMLQRCSDIDFYSYRYYGARGVIVCDEWGSNFEPFMKWALVNGYADKLTIDRIDTNGNYEPSNCQWITQHKQILKQERFSHRDERDKHIIFMDNGKFQIAIKTGTRKNRNTMHAMFDNIEIARVERNIMEFCMKNNLEYKYPYYMNDVSGTKKGDRVKRKLSKDAKIENMIDNGENLRLIAKKLKVSAYYVFRLSKNITQKQNTSSQMYYI